MSLAARIEAARPLAPTDPSVVEQVVSFLRPRGPRVVLVQGIRGPHRLAAALAVADHLGGTRVAAADLGAWEAVDTDDLRRALPDADAALLNWAGRLGRALPDVLHALGESSQGDPEAPAPVRIATRLATAAEGQPLVFVLAGLDEDPSGRWVHLLEHTFTIGQELGASLKVVATVTNPAGALAEWLGTIAPGPALLKAAVPEGGDGDPELATALEALPDAAREIVRTGALCGEAFPVHPVLTALGMPDEGDEADDLIDQVDDEAVDGAELVDDLEGGHRYTPLVGYQFTSEAAWRTARADLFAHVSPEQQAERAGRLALILERTGIAVGLPALWRAAGQADRAARYQALTDWAGVIAGDLTSIESLRWRIGLGGPDWEVDERRGRYASKQLLQLMDAIGPAAVDARVRVAGLIDELAAVLPLAETQARATLGLADTWRSVGRYADAAAAARRAARGFEGAGLPAVTPTYMLGLALAQAGRARQARRVLEVARHRAEPADRGRIALTLGRVSGVSRRPHHALAELNLAEEAFQAASDRFGLAQVGIHRAILLRATGKHDLAWQVLDSALSIADEVLDLRSVCEGLLEAGRWLRVHRKHEEALGTMNRALQGFSRMDDAASMAAVHVAIGRVLIGMRDRDAADEHRRAARELTAEETAGRGRAVAALVAAIDARRAGEADAVERMQLARAEHAQLLDVGGVLAIEERLREMGVRAHTPG